MNEEVTEEKQEEVKEDVTKAFGNDTEAPAKETADPKAAEQKDDSEQKQEGAESASKEKQSVKTYTQAEVDAMMTKARRKYESKGNQEDQMNNVETNEVIENEETPSQEETSQDLATGLTIEKYAQAELKASMAIAGIDPKKVQKAVRLIDVANVLDNGQYSEEKANQEIEALLKDWPELKQAQEESNNNAFYFGAPEQAEQNQEEKQKGMFSSIFGNK